jgi:UDP-N-acetylmuramoylalanine--D-glutamate ligase
MKIAILGFGGEGQAAYEYWARGNEITVCDANSDVNVPEVASARLGPDYLKNLSEFDLLVRSPGLPPREIVAANPDNPAILDKITSVTNEFFGICPTKNIIGVTGTKGKGTTSTLITRILEAAGKRVHLGGNIGTPLLNQANKIKPDDWVVLELSSFQLIDAKYSPHIALCLMVAPEHLDWHQDMDEYVAAKQGLFRWQTASDVAIYNRNNAHSTAIASVSPAPKRSYEVPGPGAEPHNTTGAYLQGDTIYVEGTPICKASDVGLLGRHNLENICAAAITTWDLIDHNVDVLRQVISSFTGLPHRLELVRELDNVKYYNDSFAASPDAAIAALNAVPGPKVMIMGGFDRDLPLEGLVQSLAAHQAELRKVLLIGASSERLAKALDMASFTNYEVLADTTMPQVVAHARSLVQAGDSVVLSPGFASFDMFKNFEDRGNQFRTAVEAL